MSSAFGDLTGTRIVARDAGRATQEAADNLVRKSLDAVADEPRARTLLTRAAALTRDLDSPVPAKWAAYMLLHNTVHDEMEEADLDEVVWLDAAEEVLGAADGLAERTLRSVLDIAAQEREADVSDASERRMARLGRGADVDDWLVETETDVDALFSLVRLTAAYLEAVDRRLG